MIPSTYNVGDITYQIGSSELVYISPMKLDRKVWGIERFSDAEKSEAKELKRMSYQEKSRAITYLRECVYGKMATIGRVERIFEVSEFERK